MNKKLLIIIPILIVTIILIIVLKPNNTPKELIKGEEKVIEFKEKININIEGKDFTATLLNNETTNKLETMFPLDASMNELNGNEKYIYLYDTLPTKEEKVNNIKTGDILLYGEDCLVIFYDSFNTSYSYTKVGSIDNPDNLKEVVGTGSIRVKFSLD